MTFVAQTRVGAAVTDRIGAMPRPGAAPEVGFDAGLSERATHVRLEEFDGPLALLLAVIEARQLDVLTVPLGGLAEAYLDALATLEGDDLQARLGQLHAHDGAGPAEADEHRIDPGFPGFGHGHQSLPPAIPTGPSG